MAAPFVPDDFEIPTRFDGPGFHLEPLGPVHNDRDYEAWTSSIDHIHSTPGFPGTDGWPHPMSLEDNLADLIAHAEDFESRRGFTYSILDGEAVIGCVYIYPSRKDDCDASVSSWVTASRAELDRVVWEALTKWFEGWPFSCIDYDSRD